MNLRFFTPAALAFAVLSLAPIGFAQTAVAVLSPTSGNQVAGTVVFTTAGDSGVHVVADVTGLPPGKHGFHIHEFGDIRDTAKAMATGGHFDPSGTHHHALVQDSGSADAAHHAGDMGNLTADESGHAHLDLTLPGISLSGEHSILGHAVIVHAKPDDGGQPTGNAGGRLAQGVIGMAKTQ